MKKLVLSLCAVFMMAASVAAVTDPNPTDFVLVAYQLSAAQESQFSNTNGAESAFWKLLTLNTTTIDYMLQTPSDNGRAGAGFEDEYDARLSIWAAYGVTGLYLYYEVVDNDFVDAVSQRLWANDAIDFFLDGENSTQDFVTDPTLFYVSKITQSTVQYQFSFGGIEAPTNFIFSHLNPAWDGITLTADASIIHETKTFLEGEGMGIFMEAFPGSSAVTRMQEWLIPWSKVSDAGITMPSINDKIAAVFGYNDVDGDMTGTSVDQLRWKMSDPWGADDCWGDIEFGGPLADIVAVLNPNYKSNARNGKVLGSEFYSVIGKKLPVVNGKVVAPRNSIIIERQLTSTGIKAVQFLAK